MISAADYADWAHFAGLYVRNVSHADLYRTYAAKLSPPGVVTRLVHDFLQDNPGGINLDAWRSQCVYEIEDDAQYRLDRTADALAAVGAVRAGERVRTAEDKSFLGRMHRRLLGGGPLPDPASLMKGVDLPAMMAEFRANVARVMPGVAKAGGFPEAEPKPVPVDPEMETREQIEHLLVEYVLAHQADLRADMDRHGDPRQRPGFNPAAREKELEQIRQHEIDREVQVETAEKLERALDKLGQQLVKSGKPSESKNRLRREILDEYRKYADRPARELLPPMAAWLMRARQVIDEHADFFRPKPIDDAALLARLDEIGAYEVDFEEKNVCVRWDDPRGLDCDWAEFALTVVFPAKKKTALRERLDTIDRLRRRWAKHQEDLMAQVLEAFENYYEQQPTWFDDYEKDADGRPTTEAILEHAGTGGIRIAGEEEGGSIGVFFHVEWDEEHGMELWLDDEPDPADDAAAAGVQIHDAGPSLTAADLSAFAARTGLTLPAEYRGFLLRANGGRPEPNHFVLKRQGCLPLDIVLLYSLSDVEAAWPAHCGAGHPAHLVPVGLATMAHPMTGGDLEATLLLRVSGPKAGQLLVSMADAYAGMPAPAALYEAQCLPVASTFTRFLAILGGPMDD